MEGPLVAPPQTPSSSSHTSVDLPDRQGEKRAKRPEPPVNAAALGAKVIPACILLIVVFWANLSHLYGAFYLQGKHTRRAHVPVVDFDSGGAFGQALLTAAASVSGTYSHPTYFSLDPTKTSPEKLKHDVFSGKYWTALYVTSGASERWAAATNGSSTAAYDPEAVWAHITLAARYYAFYEGNFYATSEAVLGAAGAAFSATVAAPALANSSSLALSTARSAFAIPVVTTEVYAASQDFTMSNKALINTVGVVMPILMQVDRQFFFTMAFNGISNSLHLYAKSHTKFHLRWRIATSTVWPIIAALCSTGWTWTFKGDYPLPAKAFFAYWAVTTVLCMICIDLIDVVTAYIPIGFVPPIFLTWIICNIESTLIVSRWFAVSYFFPGLHWWQTVITIITEGGVNHLRYNLPVLAGWLIVAKVASGFATRKRVKAGRIAFAADPTYPRK
ncbi:hypothetical protein RQP46_005379 [Phenoliferia psychrophenolica]